MSDQEAAAWATSQDRKRQDDFPCPASLKADLDRYAALHSQTYGEAVDAVTLIPICWRRSWRGSRIQEESDPNQYFESV